MFIAGLLRIVETSVRLSGRSGGSYNRPRNAAPGLQILYKEKSRADVTFFPSLYAVSHWCFAPQIPSIFLVVLVG